MEDINLEILEYYLKKKSDELGRKLNEEEVVEVLEQIRKEIIRKRNQRGE